MRRAGRRVTINHRGDGVETDERGTSARICHGLREKHRQTRIYTYIYRGTLYIVRLIDRDYLTDDVLFSLPVARLFSSDLVYTREKQKADEMSRV